MHYNFVCKVVTKNGHMISAFCFLNIEHIDVIVRRRATHNITCTARRRNHQIPPEASHCLWVRRASVAQRSRAGCPQGWDSPEPRPGSHSCWTCNGTRSAKFRGSSQPPCSVRDSDPEVWWTRTSFPLRPVQHLHERFFRSEPGEDRFGRCDKRTESVVTGNFFLESERQWSLQL